MNGDRLTPEELYQEAMKMIGQGHPEMATAYAVTGLLSMAIGAAQAAAKLMEEHT